MPAMGPPKLALLERVTIFFRIPFDRCKMNSQVLLDSLSELFTLSERVKALEYTLDTVLDRFRPLDPKVIQKYALRRCAAASCERDFFPYRSDKLYCSLECLAREKQQDYRERQKVKELDED